MIFCLACDCLSKQDQPESNERMNRREKEGERGQIIVQFSIFVENSMYFIFSLWRNVMISRKVWSNCFGPPFIYPTLYNSNGFDNTWISRHFEKSLRANSCKAITELYKSMEDGQTQGSGDQGLLPLIRVLRKTIELIKYVHLHAVKDRLLTFRKHWMDTAKNYLVFWWITMTLITFLKH